MLKLFTLLFCMMATAVFCTTDPPVIYKQKHAQHLIFENYLDSDRGPIGMGGYNFETYMTENSYYILSVLEAVGGQYRAGYAVASMGLGWELPLTEELYFDMGYLVGAGGGGHLTDGVGGGLSTKLQYGLRWYFLDRFAVNVHWGWLDYPDGTLSTAIYNISFTWLSFEFRTKSDPN